MQSQYNDIDENGLNGHQRIAIKSSATMKKIDENGLSIYSKSATKMKETMKSKEHSKGSKNPNSKIINIYNAKDELLFVTEGNFTSVVRENKLPSGALIKSYQKGGLPIYQTNKSKLVANQYKNLLYIGWYAKIIPQPIS